MDSRPQRGMAAMNPMLLQHALRGLCGDDSQWVYAVFWRILPRNYPPPQWDVEGGIMDRSKGNRRNWILVWEDGFCNFPVCSSAASDSRSTLSSSFFSVPHDVGSNDKSQQQFEPAMNPELFFKMSHDAYNFGEGLIGKVAVDRSHKWVYHEPLESETGYILTPWHGHIDPHPRTWEGQFKAGIQTIAVIAVEEGVLQLGSTKRVMEDLNFVLCMQRKFNFLHSVPGVFVPHPSSSGGTTESQQPSPNSQSDGTGSSDQFLFHGVASDPWHPIIAPTSAGKMGPDPESSESLNSNQYLTFSNGVDREGIISKSPPEALLDGLLTIPHTLVPSMSSLQALLSKLPSVTGPQDNNNIIDYVYASHGNLYPSNGSFYPSDGNFEATNGGGFNAFNGNQLPAMSSDGSGLQRLVDGEYRVISPAAYSSVGNSVGEDGEFESQNCAAYDNFTELIGIPEALENNGDSSYSSFLNEMCS